MTSALSAPQFHNEKAAHAFAEARISPEGPVCPHCGVVERISKTHGNSTRVGIYKRYQRRKPFTVKIGNIFEENKVAMHIWMQAMFLIGGSKKGISAKQLYHMLAVTLKIAWLKHLHLFVAEFEFRYTNHIGTDFNGADRADAAILGAVGKRLTYVQSCART